MADSDKEIEILDSEFSELLKQFEEFIISHKLREKYIITEWLTKLKNSKASVDERKLRNRFLKHFVNNQEAENNIFISEPFNNIPKDFSGPLLDLKKILPKDPDEVLNPSENEKRLYMSDLFDNLHDKGAFLAQQPVPRNGSFFIFVFRPEEEPSYTR